MLVKTSLYTLSCSFWLRIFLKRSKLHFYKTIAIFEINPHITIKKKFRECTILENHMSRFKNFKKLNLFYFIPTILHQYYSDQMRSIKKQRRSNFQKEKKKRKVIQNKIKIKLIIYVFGLVYQYYSLQDQPIMFGGIKKNL